jgi:hypothetical protein
MAEPTEALPKHVDVLNALLDIMGAIELCAEAAAGGSSDGGVMSSINGTLTLAIAAIERLYEQIDVKAIRGVWPAAAEEVAHG